MSFSRDSLPSGIDALFAEAERQLNICNACRYCEGYCAVFPALERRTLLDGGDISHLANLCHDCRACLYACMYASPHEFAVNPPRILAQLRGRTYAGALDSPAPPAHPTRARLSALGGLAGTLALVAVLAIVSEGATALVATRSGGSSPYDVISYPILLVVMTLPFVWSAAALARAGVRYWRRTRGPLADLLDAGAWRRALREAGELRYLKGGGADCQYPTDRPSPLRRRLHGAMAYGFLACVVSTISAAVEQDVAGIQPPYPWLSVPVIAGTLGGIGLVIGCAGLIALKTETQDEDLDVDMRSRDYSLLCGLLVLATTGLATLVTRATPAYGPLLVIHLSAVAVAFAVTPYTKFCHVLYRMLALVQDNIERAAEAVAAANGA